MKIVKFIDKDKTNTLWYLNKEGDNVNTSYVSYYGGGEGEASSVFRSENGGYTVNAKRLIVEMTFYFDGIENNTNTQNAIIRDIDNGQTHRITLKNLLEMIDSRLMVPIYSRFFKEKYDATIFEIRNTYTMKLEMYKQGRVYLTKLYKEQ